MKTTHLWDALAYLPMAALAALLISGVWACGGDKSSNSETQCTKHEDCSETQICDPETHQCIEGTCGDGVVRGDESCDEGTNNSDSVPDACRTDCQPARCGDGVADSGEECDASDLAGETCASKTGLSEGQLTCSADCQLNDSRCHECGNGTMDGPEVCDASDLGGQTCEGLGHSGGQLVCSTDCTSLDESRCFECGDQVCSRDRGENRALCPADCGWISVAAGQWRTCALRGDGTMWCWGYNVTGELGIGTLDSTSVPQMVPILDQVIEIALSFHSGHTCALQSDERLFCWGNNTSGQLGTGTTINSTVPVEVQLTLPAIAAWIAEATSCAFLDDSGTTRRACWGNNFGSMYGNGRTDESLVPLLIDDTFSQAALGNGYGCGVEESTGLLWCWGNNYTGQLGDGTRTNSLIPVLTAPPNGLVAQAISTGRESACALDSDGYVQCWGGNSAGQLGNGSNAPDQTTPVLVSNLENVAMISCGNFHSCALDETGQVSCWGSNNQGQLGDGTQTDRNSPVPVALPGPAIWVSAGFDSTCTVLEDGRLFCWGGNTYGQLGLGDGLPDKVLEPTETLFPIPD